MGLGAFLEPLIVVSFLAGGTLVNRDTATSPVTSWNSPRAASPVPWNRKPLARVLSDVESVRDDDSDWASSDSDAGADLRYRRRTVRFWRWRHTVVSPSTEVFKDRLLSRVLRKFPFLVEAWYWALIYWVYQLGRAFTAVLIIDSNVVDVARRHALQLIHLEQRLHVFIELPFQQYFLERPALLHWINRIYSFIHIPGTIMFLVVLYYLTTTRPARQLQRSQAGGGVSPTRWRASLGRMNPALYEARRRTMAMCNLVAFIVFTAWPCMPPRLLSDPAQDGDDADEALSYGFVDTVHSAAGESSVWTTNRFCNQYAAMPSLHFGYSFLVGLTIATLPLEGQGRLGLKRAALVLGAMIYPATILTAIIATANHYVLDAAAGAVVCLVAWRFNGFLLNLLPLEDYFLWCVRIHKPAKVAALPAEGKYSSLRL